LSRLPAAALRHPLTWLYVWFLLLPLVMGALKSTVSLGTEIVVFSLLAIAYNLLMGYTGLVSFGHGAFFGIGGYAAGLTQIHLARGMVIPLLAGVAGATLAGFVIGFLLMRKRGVYFSLLTLAFTQMFFYIVYGATRFTGGENGLGGIERFPLGAGSLRLDLGDKQVYYYASAVVAAAAIYVLWRIVHSPFGRVLEAIRENETRAGFVGYDVKRYKLTAFVLSCGFSGLAGALYTFLLNFAYPESLHVTMAGEIAAMTLVGGMRSFAGPAVGAAVFVFMRDLLSSWTENWLVYFGVIFIAFVMFSPNGIVGVFQRLRGLARTPAAPSPGSVLPAETLHAAAAPGGGGGAQGETLLDVRGVMKRFGALAAVDHVTFQIRRGELRSIIGPNGAGKTTLFNVLTGLLRSDGGAAAFRGTELTALPPHRIVSAGVSRSFQIISIFHALTVFDNVRIALQAKHRCRFAMLADREGFPDLNEEARRLIREVGLAGKEQSVASSLSHGDQRLLEIGIALGTNPELLLLDEPLAGLAAHERGRVAELIRELRRALTIVLIEHDIDQVLALSDRITVLHQGRVIAEGAPAEIQQNPEVQTAYLGHLQIADARPETPAVKAGEALLHVESVNTFYGKSHVLHDVSLEVRRGECVAFLGRNGAGKTTTLATITGVVPPRGGRVVYRGRDVAGRPPEEIARLGIGLVPQGRRIFPNLTVRENVLIGARPAGARDGGTVRAWSLDRVLATFPKLLALASARAGTLSGGELQQLAIARALMGNVELLLLDEPFEGLAPAVIEVVWNVLQGIKGETTMLLVEQNADLALALADRAYVINNGSIGWSGEARALHADRDLRLKLLGV
jgi:ABC-type branched-subunit amino acid transport system ATPase component/ABC-type branched-subunit amino acid transport system permease subunit